jgi:Helicase HerA, central domain
MAKPWTFETRPFIDALYENTVPVDLLEPLGLIALKLFYEDFSPPPPPRNNDALAVARYKDALARYRSFTASDIQVWTDTVLEAFSFFALKLPRLQGDEFTVRIEPSQEAIDHLLLNFRINRNRSFFRTLQPTIEYNYSIFRKNDPPENLLRGTPFLELRSVQLNFSIPRSLYLEHAAIFAPSGHGKTQLLQKLIAGFLSDNPPAMFVLDSQGEMLSKIERLALFETALNERLVILDPEDATPPALNFFQIGSQPGHDAQLHELFNYLFSAIDSELTAKQGTAVTYLLKLMRIIPGATIETLKDVMEEQVKSIEASRYYDKICTLDQITQDFFRNQFFDKAMAPTRNQVARRLYTILGNPIFTRMFAAKETRFSALQAMRDRKIVLINTSQRFLGQEASAVFGRFMIAQCLAAAYERGASDDLALLIVDEASEYFDAKTERILSQARKYGLGLLFATQYLEQMPPQVKAAVNGNTAIKLAGPVGYNDAMMLGREMYTTADFIRSMRKTDKATQFAAYVRSTTPGAIALSIPFGTLEQQPTMNETVRLQRRRDNAQRYGALAQSPETSTEPVRPTEDPRSPDDPVHIAPKPWRS